MRRLLAFILCTVLALSCFITASQAEGIALKKGVTFSEGLLPFSKGGKYGYIDKNANIVLDAKWDDACSFSEGLAAVQLDGKYGYIDKSGNMVIAPQWDVAKPFSGGVACIATGSGMELEDVPEEDFMKLLTGEMTQAQFDAMLAGTQQFGLINTKGEILSDPQWDAEIEFKEDYAVVVNDEKYGFIDKSGYLVIPCEYTKAFGFSEGLASVTTDSVRGYINKSGEMVISSSWESNGSFNCGRACVSKEDIKGNKKYGYIDASGNVVIDYKYDYASGFTNDYAYVKIDKNEYMIDLDGKVALDGDKVGKSDVGSWGSSGYSIKLYARYENGLIPVMKTTFYSIDWSTTQEYGFADLQGKIIVEGEWSYIHNFVNGYAIAEKSNGKKGYISDKGMLAISAQYDDVTDFSEDGYAVVWKGDTWYIIDTTGRILV